MKIVRDVIITLLVLPTLGFGETKPAETDKISNDQPERPLQLPPASSEVKEAFDDFERFRRRGAWERALKSLYTIPGPQALRFVDGSNGFIIPVARKRREALAELPPEGQAAYRLFYDDEAKKLFDKAEGAAELATLERIYSSYFPTTVGDNAADRLGDLYFEMGRFDRAADCWLAVLRERPDTDLSPALLSVKAVLALTRAGRPTEADATRRDLMERYAGEKVSIGGRLAPVAEQLQLYLPDEKARTDRSLDRAEQSVAGEPWDVVPALAHVVSADWQMRFGDSIVAGMTAAEQTQWETNALSGAVPAVAIVGTRLYANFLAHVFALDLESGKLLWRSASFHNVETPASQDQARMIDPTRFAIVASKNYVWSLGRDLQDPDQFASFRLICRRAEGGDVVWQTTDLSDYGQIDLVGTPVLAGETLFVAAKTPMAQQQQRPGQQYVLAIRAQDGKLLWKTEVGTFRQSQRYYYYGMPDTTPQPKLLYWAGAVYLDTHVGVLARLDAETGGLEWGYGYQTEPVQSSGRFFFFEMYQTTESTASGVPFRSADILFAKGAQSSRIYALDPHRLKVLWDRPIAKSTRIIGADDRTLFLGGPEISALDLRTRTLTWATRVPGGSAEARVLVRPGGLWQLTPRGIFEIDDRTGRVRRIFRGDDTGSSTGSLYITRGLLVAVTNRTIIAYPMASAAANALIGVEDGPATINLR